MTTSIFVRNAGPAPVPSPYQDGLVLDLFAEPDRSTVATSFGRLVERAGQPTQIALEFLLFGAAVFVADKKVPRIQAPDRWTRDFALRFPVVDPARWAVATPALREAVSFLTGDRWQLEQRAEFTHIWGARWRGRAAFDAVCLFSGGLDSLVGAINLLEDPAQPRVLLIGHYDSTLTPQVQRKLANELAGHYGPARVRLVQVLVRPAEERARQQYPLPSGREATTRSRSLIFISLGLAAASALGGTAPLHMPENGFIALNVPLINARLGSCSTRTAHPFFLNRLHQALSLLGITNPIVNPLERLTKGEVLARCGNQRLLHNLVAQTVSCAHPELGRYERTGYGNCGYCFPCLIRRASLHAVDWDDGTQYQRDICTDEEILNGRSARGRDARAIFAALHRAGETQPTSLIPLRAGPLPNGPALKDFARLHAQGLVELRTLFTAKASPSVRRIAGLWAKDD